MLQGQHKRPGRPKRADREHSRCLVHPWTPHCTMGGMLYLGKTLEHGISCMVANSGRLRGSRHSLATWSFSSVEPILRSSLDPANDDEDLYNWMARQRGPSSPLDSPSSRSAPRESGVPTGGIPDAQAVFEPLLQLLGACTMALQTPGPRLALSALIELLRVDLVESESPEQPQRRRSKPGQRLFVDTSTDTPALVCDRLALELDVRHPGSPGTCAHVAVDVQYVAQQVNMPLLRLLNQFSSMYENVKETRLELQCRRPRADSVIVPPQPHPGGSHESVAPALADRFTISVGAEHKVLDGPEGCRGNCKYEQLHEHRVDMENGDGQARHREMPPRPAAAAERVPLAVFAMGHVKRIRLLAMLSGLRLEAELSGLQASGTHKETLRERSRQSESSATGRLGPASVVLLEGQPPNHQMVVTMAVGTSQALGSSCGWGPTARHAALLSQLSTTLQELRRSAPGRTAQRQPTEETALQGSPMPPVINSRSVPPVVRLDLLLEGLTTGAALLPSLRAHYHMGPLTGTGCTGSQARFTVHLPQHSLSFNTKVPPACEANLPSRASVELPPVQVAAEYLQDPGGPSQRDADGVVLRRGSYLSALAEIGTFEHSLTTDLLNHLVLVQKVFMKEVNEVVQKMSGTRPLRLWEGSSSSGSSALSGGQLLFSLQLRLRGIRLTATTPTASAVRLETGTLDLQLSNRVQNASRAVTAMKLFGKGQVDLSLALAEKGAVCLPEKVDEVLVDIFYYLEKSAKRKEALRQFQEIHDADFRKILKHVPTRWLSLGKCLTRLLDQWKPLLSFFLHEVKDKKSPSFLDSYQIPKAAAKQATAPAEKPDQCKTKRKNLTQAPSVPAKKAKVSCTQKTDQHCPTREERLFVFLSLETNRAYCLFLQNIIPIFEKVNLSLQAQAPHIHVLRSLLLELLRDIFSRFVNPSWLKRSPELLNLDYHSREAQKGDEDLIIGQETRTVVDKLKPSEQQEFFEAVRHYFVTVCDYMRHKFPLTDPALLNAEVVQLKTLDTMSFRKVRFFVDSFPAMLPLQPGESKMEAVDALEVEFSKLQAQDLPPHILQERVDAQWRMVSQLRTADGRLKFSRIAENTLFEEAEFQQFAFFKTRICLRNALQDEMISSQYDDKEAVLITMNRPMIYFQPIALDKAVLVWLNYKNAYEYWNEQRGSLNKEVLTATQQLFERVPQFPQLSSQALGTLFLQLTVQDLGICMPLNKGTLTNSRLFDADATPAVVVTLENTRISACSCGSLVSKARFTGLCLRFADEFEVSMEDWKPSDATTTNLCVVSEGTYEICSRTIAAQASSNAKWILNVQWQMEGVDIHVDVGISKALSALFRTLTALTGEGDEGESPEEQARAAQEPVTLRHACLLLDPSSTIEQEERRLKELETAVFNDFRRDVIKKLRRQSVKAASIKDKLGLGTVSRLPADTPEEEVGRIAHQLEISPTKDGTHTRTASFDMSDLPATPRRPMSLVHRELSLDSVFSQTTASVTNSGAPTPTSEPSEPALSPQDDILPPPVTEPRAGHTTPVPSKQQQVEPSIDFELDIKVFFNSGKCVLHTRDHEEEAIKMTRTMRKERSFSGGLPDGGSPTRRRSGPRSHPSSSRMRFPPAASAAPSQVTTDFTVFLVPGLDVKVHYNSWTMGGESPVDPPARKGGTKKATLFAWITLQSIPEETVISPHILDFLEQALEAIPMQQAAKASPVASVDGGGLVLEESQYGSFPVDVIVYFRMQPSILRFSCLPVSRVECLLRLPSVDLAFSSKRADEGPKMAATTADASPLAVTERKDSLSLQVEFVKVNMSRSRHIGADNGRALIRFSALCDVGSASFKYDMRRLTEILAFPKAWYRRSIARRMFLGDPTTAGSAFGDQAAVALCPRVGPIRSPLEVWSLAHPKRKRHLLKNDQQRLPGGQAWETLLLYALNLSRLNVHMNMGNVMGNTSWLTQGFRSQGRLAIDSRGHKDLNLAVDLDGSSLDAKGGIVGGAIELSRIHTHMGLQESWGREPVHTLTLALWAAESRLDYMGSSVLMGRVSQLTVELRDEWRLCEGCEATKRPALLFVHGQVHWDQLQLLISKSTTPDLAKMGAKLEEFFSQQFHSSRRVFSSMRLAGPRPRRADRMGGNVSLACFHGVSFRSKAWALFSLRQPSIHFATEAQDVLGPQAAVDTHVVQHLTFRLGHAAGSSGCTGSMATVCRISRNVLFPPQFKSVSEWFQYAFASSELDDVGALPRV
ncbi:hypothetical protein MTO96_027629 [Rhipicephalus appendiculatus]